MMSLRLLKYLNVIRKKALAAIGNLDIGSPEALIPTVPEMRVLGASSDHLFLDVQDCETYI